eukprot:1988584-Alexandrium_andersonii.AAC.1
MLSADRSRMPAGGSKPAPSRPCPPTGRSSMSTLATFGCSSSRSSGGPSSGSRTTRLSGPCRRRRR